MDEPLADLEGRASEYAATRGLSLGAQIGDGRDGTIWAATRQPRAAAVKAHRRANAYRRERDAYLRLRDAAVETICGLNVPSLCDYDDDRLVIEMEIVAPPFILDFAGVYFDGPADFSAEVMTDWEEKGVELFGDRWGHVRQVLSRLRGLGIYYYDLSLRNICFD